MKDESPYGASQFFNLMQTGEAEWALMAVNQPVDVVARHLVDLRHAKAWMRDVPRRSSTEAIDELARLVPVVQIKDNPWTVVFRSLFYVNEQQLLALIEDATALSSRLDTKVFAFAADDTSGAMGYALVEGGRRQKAVEAEETAEGGTGFQSVEDDNSALDIGDEETIEQVLRSQGIYLPACYPKSDGKVHWLVAEGGSANLIERADLIEW